MVDREENKILRLLLGEALYELGRAVSISRIQMESNSYKSILVKENPITKELLAITKHGR